MVTWSEMLGGALGGLSGTTTTSNSGATSSTITWYESASTAAHTGYDWSSAQTTSAYGTTTTASDYYIDYTTGRHYTATEIEHQHQQALRQAHYDQAEVYQRQVDASRLAQQARQTLEQQAAGVFNRSFRSYERYAEGWSDCRSIFGSCEPCKWGWANFESDLEVAEREEREEKKKQAEDKAVILLETLIGDEIEVYKKTGRVFVKGEKGTYIVRKDRTVQKIERNKIIDLCVHIRTEHKCPSTDHVIALKMLLENDEKHILKIANRVGSESRPKELPLAACM